MEFEYKVTVVIPVYNVERYLEDCLDSLLRQTIPQSEMEVLMVNDGSVDGSLEICERFSEAHDNFKVLSQENRGVSAARNNGIRNAKGKYILYLDADDTLSSETAKNVTDFFDEHYEEVDVVTYPLVYRREAGESSHWRYQYLKGDGVYDLDKYPYICQTTINICVKNKKDESVLFNVALSAYEDQAYNLAQSMPLNRIGYCKNACYIYYQRSGGTVKQFSHPFYQSKTIINVYKDFLHRYDCAKYVQAMILYDIGWRVQSDSIYPYHYAKEELETYKTRFSQVLDKCDVELIFSHPGINDAHRYFLLSLKGENRPFCQLRRDHKAKKDELLLLDQEGQIRRSNTILIVLQHCKIENDSLYILAFLKEFAFDFMEKPKLYAVLDGETYIEIPLFVSQLSHFWSKIRTNTFWGFSFERTLDGFSTLQFVVEIEGKEFNAKYWLGDRQSIQPKQKRNYLPGKNNTVFFHNNQFVVVPNLEEKAVQAKKNYEKYLFKNKKKQWLVRWYARKKPGRVIWLYEDTYNAVDNAYYQFLHDFEKNDGIERYYVCDKAEIDWRILFTPGQQKQLIQRKGKKHKRLFIQADKILTSFIGHDDFVPFDRDTILYYWDLFHFEVIYLQHGVMHAKLDYMYSKEKIYMIDRVVASTHFEKENLVNKLAFREKDVICCGMPRLDQLTACEKKKKILFAPSWRSYLVTTDAAGKRLAQTNFEASDYFQEIRDFLEDEQLNTLLAEKGYVLDIKLHPNFEMYAGVFNNLCNEGISFVKEVELGEYMACVTDFTSFMYDFFYLDIPVFVHIFDYDRFKAGLHTYRELCWPMEKEYPYYCEDTKDLIHWLMRFLEAPEDVEEKFKQFTKGMFFSRGCDHADRLYEYLMGNSARENPADPTQKIWS